MYSNWCEGELKRWKGMRIGIVNTVDWEAAGMGECENIHKKTIVLRE